MGRVQPGSLCFKEQVGKWDFSIPMSFLMKLHVDLTHFPLAHLYGCVKTAGTRPVSGKEASLPFVLCLLWTWHFTELGVLRHSSKPQWEVFTNPLYRGGHRDSGRLSNLPVVHSKKVVRVCFQFCYDVHNMYPCNRECLCICDCMCAHILQAS